MTPLQLYFTHKRSSSLSPWQTPPESVNWIGFDEMFVSRPVVHPVEAPPLREGGNNAPRVRMKDVQGMAGTPGGLVLRLFQFLSAVVSLCVMVTISDFYSVTAFWCDFLVRFPFKYVITLELNVDLL